MKKYARPIAPLLSCLLGVACAENTALTNSPVPSGDLAVLARQAEGFAQASGDYSLVFPDDHGPHPAFRLEWWYLTANLKDAAGRELGAQWTLFRLARRPMPERSRLKPEHAWSADQSTLR